MVGCFVHQNGRTTCGVKVAAVTEPGRVMVVSSRFENVFVRLLNRSTENLPARTNGHHDIPTVSSEVAKGQVDDGRRMRHIHLRLETSACGVGEVDAKQVV